MGWVYSHNPVVILMNTNADSNYCSNECEIVIPIVLKIPIYIEPIVIEIAPTCAFSSHSVNLPVSELTSVSSAPDRLPKKSKYWSIKAMSMTLQIDRKAIRNWMHLGQTELAFTLNALNKVLKFSLNRILRIMSKLLYRVGRSSGQLRSHSRSSGSNSRGVFY
jgi:hypothetical protein